MSKLLGIIATVSSLLIAGGAVSNVSKAGKSEREAPKSEEVIILDEEPEIHDEEPEEEFKGMQGVSDIDEREWTKLY